MNPLVQLMRIVFTGILYILSTVTCCYILGMCWHIFKGHVRHRRYDKHKPKALKK